MIKLSATNRNYAAKMCILQKPVKHPDADRLQGWSIDENIAWTDMSYKEGDQVIYFPVETVINSSLLSNGNLYSNKELNVDKTKKGYFSDSGRVKAIKLRGEYSEGIVLKYETVQELLNLSFSFINNEYFDQIDDICLCKKYIPVVRNSGSGNKEKKPKNYKIIPEYFKFHYDTEKYAINKDKFKPTDDITVTLKYHGTSIVLAHVPIIIKIPIISYLLKKIGRRITKYATIASSRQVIKCVNKKITASHGYYDFDIWRHVHNTVRDKIEKNYTLYGEVVGYLPTNKLIQKGYDYGMVPITDGTYILGINYNLIIYRITKLINNQLVDLNYEEILAYCRKHGLESPAIFYRGVYSDQEIASAFQSTNTYSKLCANRVPEEGIVIRNETTMKAYKWKTHEFLQYESGELDNQSEVLS